MKGIQRRISALVFAAAACLTAGCSRSEMNYEIAESIGTVGKYPDNEPVETPKMKAERQQSEAASESEARNQEILDYAASLAAEYRYDEAIDYLNREAEDNQNEEIQDAITEYTSKKSTLVKYEGSIPHLSFPVLVEDPQMAFDGDDYSSSYESMITTAEFKEMLQSLYDNGYVLVSMEDIAGSVTSVSADAEESTESGGNADSGSAAEESSSDSAENGGTAESDTAAGSGGESETGTAGGSGKEFALLDILLPADKKPIVISQDNLNYSGIRNGDGIAVRLVLDDEGNVKAKYTDSGGHDKTGDYDLIPILNSFVDEHPDFSYHGAKGIVSVSGTSGVFGYDITPLSASSTEASGESASATELTDEQKTVEQIADELKQEGWEIACAGYSHSYMNDMSLSQLTSDISSWNDQVGSLVGSTSILLYPYGGEVSYPSDKLSFLLDSGFEYLCGIWQDQDYMELGDGYLRQTRRIVNGDVLTANPDTLADFFDVSGLIDASRE